jgi:hypothetical protein
VASQKFTSPVVSGALFAVTAAVRVTTAPAATLAVERPLEVIESDVLVVVLASAAGAWNVHTPQVRAIKAERSRFPQREETEGRKADNCEGKAASIKTVLLAYRKGHNREVR